MGDVNVSRPLQLSPGGNAWEYFRQIKTPRARGFKAGATYLRPDRAA